MCHAGFMHIRGNYKALLDFQNKIIKNYQVELDSKTKERVVSVKTKTRNFNFLFYLEIVIATCS